MIANTWYAVFYRHKYSIVQKVWSLCNSGTVNKIFTPKDLDGWYWYSTNGCIKSGKPASSVSAVACNEEMVLRRDYISVAKKEGRSSKPTSCLLYKLCVWCSISLISVKRRRIEKVLATSTENFDRNSKKLLIWQFSWAENVSNFVFQACKFESTSRNADWRPLTLVANLPEILAKWIVLPLIVRIVCCIIPIELNVVENASITPCMLLVSHEPPKVVYRKRGIPRTPAEQAQGRDRFLRKLFRFLRKLCNHCLSRGVMPWQFCKAYDLQSCSDFW